MRIVVLVVVAQVNKQKTIIISMKKIKFMLLSCLFALSAHAQNQLPDLIICASVPGSFWVQASDETLATMIKNDHEESDRAYKELVGRYQSRCQFVGNDYVGFVPHWIAITGLLKQTSRGKEFEAMILATATPLRQFASERGFIILMSCNPDSVPLAELAYVTAVNAKDVNYANEELLQWVVLWSPETKYKTLASDFMIAHGDNGQLDWLMSKTEQTDPIHVKAFAERLNRPFVSTELAALVKIFPQHAEAFWRKASENGICLKEKDVKDILNIDNPQVLNVQIKALDALTATGFFKTGEAFALLTDWYPRSQEIKNEIAQRGQTTPFDSVSVEKLVGALTTNSGDYLHPSIKQRIEKELEKILSPVSNDTRFSELSFQIATLVILSDNLEYNHPEFSEYFMRAAVIGSSSLEEDLLIEELTQISSEYSLRYFASTVAAIEEQGSDYWTASDKKQDKFRNKATKKLLGKDFIGEQDIKYIVQRLKRT